MINKIYEISEGDKLYPEKLLKIKDIESSIKQGYEEVMKNKEKILGMVNV